MALIPFRLLAVAWLAMTSVALTQQSVQFKKLPAEIGAKLEQSVSVGMSLKTHTLQESEIVEQEKVESQRHQHRVVTAKVIEEGHVIEAEVEFLESSRSRNGETAADPVVGKTYNCRRKGEELLITTRDGALPPLLEYRVVAHAMESLGKPNPLADFLAGKTVQVGERLELPAEVAQQAIGFDDGMGEIERFELVLRSIQQAHRGPQAHFDAEIEAHGTGSSQMRLVITGEFVIDASTCRATAAHLTGPIGLSESRGSVGHKYQIQSTGKIRLDVASRLLTDQR